MHTWGSPHAFSKAEITCVIKLYRRERGKIAALSFNLLKNFNYNSVNTQIPRIRSLMYYFDTIRSLKYFFKFMDKLTFHDFYIYNSLLQ